MTSVDRVELLRTLIATVETGNQTTAAALLGVSQSTVCRRLQALEQVFGVRLISRSRSKFKLTGAGKRCFAHAKAFLGAWDLAFALKQHPNASTVDKQILRIRAAPRS